MAQQWQRGRRTKSVFLTPGEFADATRSFRELQRNVPFVAQLIAEGLDKKQICTRLKWSMQSLNYVLKDHKINVDRASVNRRIFRKAS